MPNRSQVCRPLVCAILVLPTSVVAQEADFVRDAASHTDELLRSSYDATGVRVGSFTAFPAVETGVLYTDNVHQSPSDRREDFGYTVAPELRLRSDWSRHFARLSASSSHVFYDRNSEENLDEATIDAAVRVDVTSQTAVEVDGSFRLGQEDRDSVEVPAGAVSRPEILTWEAGAGLSHRFNRLTASLRGELEIVEYGDTEFGGGLSQDNGDRDYVETGATLRLGYEVSPVLQPFVEGRYSTRKHDRELDRDGLRRDSDGYAVAGGIAVNLGPILRGEVSAGYERRDFEDATLRPAAGMTVDGTLTWAPTRLTTAVLNAGTSIDETTLTGASAAITHSADIEIAHSISYNVTARAGASYSRTRYDGTSVREASYAATASLEYLLNPNVVVRAGYAYEMFDANQPDSDYDVHTVKMGVRLQQ